MVALVLIAQLWCGCVTRQGASVFWWSRSIGKLQAKDPTKGPATANDGVLAYKRTCSRGEEATGSKNIQSFHHDASIEMLKVGMCNALTIIHAIGDTISFRQVWSSIARRQSQTNLSIMWLSDDIQQFSKKRWHMYFVEDLDLLGLEQNYTTEPADQIADLPWNFQRRRSATKKKQKGVNNETTFILGSPSKLSRDSDLDAIWLWTNPDYNKKFFLLEPSRSMLYSSSLKYRIQLYSPGDNVEMIAKTGTNFFKKGIMDSCLCHQSSHVRLPSSSVASRLFSRCPIVYKELLTRNILISSCWTCLCPHSWTIIGSLPTTKLPSKKRLFKPLISHGCLDVQIVSTSSKEITSRYHDVVVTPLRCIGLGLAAHSFLLLYSDDNHL